MTLPDLKEQKIDPAERLLLQLEENQIIEVSNIRITYAQEEIQQIRASILANGILVPLLVGPFDADLGGYPVIDGHKRKRAGRLAGLKTYPCLVVEGGKGRRETQLATLCRSDLLPFEQFLAFHGWIEETGGSAKTLAEIIGRDAATVCRVLSLTKCIPSVFEAARAGKLNVSAWNAYSKLSHPEQEAKWREKQGREPVARLKIPINTGKATGTVILSADNIDYESAETLLKEALRFVRSAKAKNISEKSAQAMWADVARA